MMYHNKYNFFKLIILSIINSFVMCSEFENKDAFYFNSQNNHDVKSDVFQIKILKTLEIHSKFSNIPFETILKDFIHEALKTKKSYTLEVINENLRSVYLNISANFKNETIQTNDFKLYQSYLYIKLYKFYLEQHVKYSNRNYFTCLCTIDKDNLYLEILEKLTDLYKKLLVYNYCDFKIIAKNNVLKNIDKLVNSLKNNTARFSTEILNLNNSITYKIVEDGFDKHYIFINIPITDILNEKLSFYSNFSVRSGDILFHQEFFNSTKAYVKEIILEIKNRYHNKNVILALPTIYDFLAYSFYNNIDIYKNNYIANPKKSFSLGSINSSSFNIAEWKDSYEFQIYGLLTKLYNQVLHFIESEINI